MLEKDHRLIIYPLSLYIKITQCDWISRLRFSASSELIGLSSAFKQIKLLLISRASTNSTAPDSVILLPLTIKCVRVRFDRSAFPNEDAPEEPIALLPNYKALRELLDSRAFSRASAPTQLILLRAKSKWAN